MQKNISCIQNITRYNMTVQILVGNGFNFFIAVGLIMPGVKKSRVMKVSEPPYSPCQSLALFMENSTSHWYSAQIHCKYALLCWIIFAGFKHADIKGVR